MESPLLEHIETPETKFQLRPNIKKLFPVLLGTFAVNLNVSIVAPFFPVYAQDQYNASPMTIALIFATYPLISMGVAPLVGLVCSRSAFDRIAVLQAGLVLNSIGSMLFGSCSLFSAATSVKVGVHFLARAVQGAGCAAVVVPASAFVAANFPKHIGSVMGLQMAFEGLGFMVGPPLGGLLFSLGFPVPFFAMGAVTLLLALAVALLRVTPDKPLGKVSARANKKAPSFLPLLNSTLLLAGVAAHLGIASVGFIDPVWQLHLQRTLGFNARAAGGMFIIPPFFFGVFADVGGGLCDKYGPKGVITMGLLLVGIGWVLVGPPPFLYQAMNSTGWAYASQFVGISMLGAGVGFITCAAMPAMLASVAYVDQDGVEDLVASLFQALQKAGEGFGPLWGGLLSSTMPNTPVINCRRNNLGCSSGFQWASFLFGTVLLLYAAATHACMPFIPPVDAPADTLVEAVQSEANMGILLNEGERVQRESGLCGLLPTYGATTVHKPPQAGGGLLQ
jgi:MFS family permease